MYFAQTNNSQYIDANKICSLLVLLYSNQVEQYEARNPKIIQHGKDFKEAKNRATKKAEEEGLQYVNG